MAELAATPAMTSHAPATDAHLLVANLHRRAMLLCAATGGKPYQGLEMAAKSLGLSPHWRRKLRHWDAAVGLTEKISPESIVSQIDLLQQEIARASTMRGGMVSVAVVGKAVKQEGGSPRHATPMQKADREDMKAELAAIEDQKRQFQQQELVEGQQRRHLESVRDPRQQAALKRKAELVKEKGSVVDAWLPLPFTSIADAPPLLPIAGSDTPAILNSGTRAPRRAFTLPSHTSLPTSCMSTWSFVTYKFTVDELA